MNEIKIPVSPGELLDKITILRIKAQRIHDTSKLANVRAELDALEATWRACAPMRTEIDAQLQELQAVNQRLWDIEDDIRDKERAGEFDAEFIRLARAVYVQNDERAAIKRRINFMLGSSIVEEKSYADYRNGRDEAGSA